MDKGDQILQAIEQWGNRISGEITEMKEDIGTLKSDVGTLKADVAVLKSDVAELNHRMAKVETEQVKIKQVIGANHLKVMGRIDQLSDQLQSHIRHSA
jgi:chromosome segregation ATPase